MHFVVKCANIEVSKFSFESRSRGWDSVRKRLSVVKLLLLLVKCQEGRSSYGVISSKQQSMSTKLYVGGISYRSTEDSLAEAFAQAGSVVSAKIITDRMTGRSRGFGFVEMGSPEEGQRAIDMWNGKELDGRTLTVNEARPLEDRPRN